MVVGVNFQDKEEPARRFLAQFGRFGRGEQGKRSLRRAACFP